MGTMNIEGRVIEYGSTSYTRSCSIPDILSMQVTSSRKKVLGFIEFTAAVLFPYSNDIVFNQFNFIVVGEMHIVNSFR